MPFSQDVTDTDTTSLFFGTDSDSSISDSSSNVDHREIMAEWSRNHKPLDLLELSKLTDEQFLSGEEYYTDAELAVLAKKGDVHIDIDEITPKDPLFEETLKEWEDAVFGLERVAATTNTPNLLDKFLKPDKKFSKSSSPAAISNPIADILPQTVSSSYNKNMNIEKDLFDN